MRIEWVEQLDRLFKEKGQACAIEPIENRNIAGLTLICF